MRTVILALAAALCASPQLMAEEDVRLTAEVDAREIGLDDQVQLTLSVSGRSLGGSEGLGLPPLKNLRVAGGPMRSTQVSFVNGAMSQSSVYVYVLQPTAVGKAEVGAARLRPSGGGEKTTEPIEINVVPGSVRPKTRVGADPFAHDPFFGGDPFGEDPFDALLRRRGVRRMPAPKVAVDVEVSRRKLHVGESLRLVYYVYTQASLGEVGFSDEPKYPGFWVEDAQRDTPDRRGQTVTLDGERYTRFAAREKLLFPTKAGQLSIPSAEMRLGLAARGPFDAGGVVTRSTKPIAIEVVAIPDVPGFSGAVGDFKASAALDRSSISLGEAVTLRFTLSGRGNLKWIERGPDVKLAGAKVFAPQVKDAVRVEAAGMSGSRTWEYVLVPQTAGRIEVPALALTYFDPQRKTTVRAATAPLALDVLSAASAQVPGGQKPVAAGSGALRLALRTELDEPAAGLPTLGTRGLLLFLLLVVAGHVALSLAGPWRHGWTLAGRGTAARAGVRAALADVDQAGRKGTSKEQAALLIEKALTDVFGTLDDAAGAGGSERDRAALAVLNEVRFLRYAPQLGDYAEKIHELAARAREVLRRWA